MIFPHISQRHVGFEVRFGRLRRSSPVGPPKMLTISSIFQLIGVPSGHVETVMENGPVEILVVSPLNSMVDPQQPERVFLASPVLNVYIAIENGHRNREHFPIGNGGFTTK